jgi:hypothetical protein
MPDVITLRIIKKFVDRKFLSCAVLRANISRSRKVFKLSCAQFFFMLICKYTNVMAKMLPPSYLLKYCELDCVTPPIAPFQTTF